jgi:hypothetical protein
MVDDAVQWMTYADIAEAFGIGADSARNLVRRKRWTRQMGNDGLARIGVPTDQIPTKADSPPSASTEPPIDGTTNPPTDEATGDIGALVALEVLREHIGRLEAEIGSLKDEVARERARGAQVDALTAILEIERKRAEELKQERDRWSAAAEAFQQQLVDLTNKPSRGFFSWLKRS